MKIESTDSKSKIEIIRTGDEGYSSFEVSVNIDIGHGFFSGCNTDLIFLNLSNFIDEIDAFILNRNISPKLNGTYDSFIQLIKDKRTSAILVKFKIGDAYCGYSDTIQYSIEGGFEINQELLSTILTEAKKLNNYA